MKLIAESGSTRTEWVLVEGDQLVHRVFTEGINPFFQARKEISRRIRLSLPDIYFKKKLEQIYFYGAGCTNKEKKDIVKASLIAQFKSPAIVESDLLAAARGLFNDTSGIACILGTGSNSCFYDGENITKSVRSGGYILGDEGSGSVLGKIFLSDLLKEVAPKELMDSFYETFGITPNDVMSAVYDRPFPNRFLAVVSIFLGDHLENEYVSNLLRENLRSFFVRNISQYDYKNHKIRFVGSVAFTYANLLQEIAQEFDTEVDRIEETSVSGLINFHLKERVTTSP